MIFDTDVLIWALRGDAQAADLIEQTPLPKVSIVSYMELLQGARDRQEIQHIKSALVDNLFETLPLRENIGHRAAVYMEEYGLKAGLGLADALVAATAVENALPLATANAKHFRVIPDLTLRPFQPT